MIPNNSMLSLLLRGCQTVPRQTKISRTQTPAQLAELFTDSVDTNCTERPSRLVTRRNSFNNPQLSRFQLEHVGQHQSVVVFASKTKTATTTKTIVFRQKKQSCQLTQQLPHNLIKMSTSKTKRRRRSLEASSPRSLNQTNDGDDGAGYDERRRRSNSKIIDSNFHSIFVMAILLLASLGTTTTDATTTLAATATTTSTLSTQLQQQQQLTSTPAPLSGMIATTANFLTNGRTSTNTSSAGLLQRFNSDNVNSNNKNNHGDINRLQPIEQVAKAEALTSAEAAPAIASVSAAALQQQQSSSRLFDMCRVQSKVGQQLTNLSQIMFQPSDICSTWNKMSKTTQTDSSSADASALPWHYIEQLNLSHNNLTVLHDSSGMSRLVNLIELKITHNHLIRCEESSLVGLQRLQILDLSHNRLMALPAKFFQPVKHTIKKLNLSFNSISVLVPNLFDSLNQLEYLDLSHNDITSHWINDRLFKNLTQLRYLDLSFNKLSVFSSPMTFSSLQQLDILSLQHNELRQVPETIQHLRYLSSLDLSQNLIHDITNASYLSNCHLLFNLNLESNLLENITRDAFSDLPALKVLNLANNRIHHLDQQAFDFVPDLHALRLDSNRLVDFGQAFVNLRFMAMLNISSNRISSFDYAQIPLGLQWLDLHSNRIDKLNNFYYSPTAQQQFSANDISNQQQAGSLGQQWQSMLRLTTLDASFNLIRELDNTSLPESLETVQLNNNQIRTIASHTFSTKSNLTRINLSNNQLATMPFDALRMQNNRDTQQTQQQQQQQQQQKFVDIYLANNPFVCNCNMGWLSQLLLASSNLMQSSMSGPNLLGALPREHTLANTYALVLARQLPRVADAQLIQCHLPFGRQSLPMAAEPHQWSPVQAANQLALQHNHHLHSRDTPLILKQSELLSSVHLCPYKSHCFALCHCCDFDACDCEMSCPENCSCYYDQTWSTNIVDCSANNQINGISQARFTQMMMGAGVQATRLQTSLSSPFSQPQVVKFLSIPEKIPMDVTELYLDGLELLHLRGNALIWRRNLKSLYLNNSQLYSIEPKALATQKALRVLQLNSNQLTELQGHEFEQQVELRELYLAHNRLVSIANTTFVSLKSLQILHLQGNQLYHMNFWSNIPAGHKLISLNLGQNPWSCQCDYIEPMLEWLHLNMKHLHDRKSVSCQYNQTSSLHLLPPLLAASNSQMEQQLSDSSLYSSSNENYPLFDKRMCLNHTVFPIKLGPSAQPTPLPVNPFSEDSDMLPPSSSSPREQVPPTYEDPAIIGPNDEPSRSPYPRAPDLQPLPRQHQMQPFGIGPTATTTIDSSANSLAADQNGFQFPPGNLNSKNGQILSFSMLFGLISLVLIIIVAALPLIHYRRSMRKWFYSNYGLSLFTSKAAKHHHQHHHHHHNHQQQQQQHHHHHHGIGSLGKHSHTHLHHPYGPSSAASTSSSSAASSNLSQALCQQQSSNGSSGGLVTTPLIVSNNTISNHQALNTAPYNDDSKLFDAYLTYSKLDEQFVNDHLAPELEYGQPSYRVALHYRDLPATADEFLADCIIETANASRRIIMVISEQLLKTEWTRHQFRAAHLDALAAANQRQRLIVVLLGQASLANLADPELVQWLKSCTCLQWAEKMFWPRLRFAMPEPANQRLQQPKQQHQQHLRYQTLAPHQQAPAGPGVGLGGKLRANLAANLLKSTGLFGGAAADPAPQQPAAARQHQHQLPMQHQGLGARPLPQPGPFGSSSLVEEHHYAHLMPSTMIYDQQQQQQQRQQLAYQQPIYGDAQQQQHHHHHHHHHHQQPHQHQQQQQQQHNQNRDNPTVPVHI